MIVTCPEPGRLRAWLDGEAGPDAAPLADHAAGCPSCRATVRELTDDAAVAAEALDLLAVPVSSAAETAAPETAVAETERALARFHRVAARRRASSRTADAAPDFAAVAAAAAPRDGEGAPVHVARGATPNGAVAAATVAASSGVPFDTSTAVAAPDSVTVAATRSIDERDTPHSEPLETRRMPIAPPFRRWRAALGGLAAALALTLVVATPEGQAAAAGVLAQFRTQRFAVVTIDPSSTDRAGFQRLERLGTLTRSGGAAGATPGSGPGLGRGMPTQEVPSVEEAARRVGFPLKQADPASLPAGVARTPKIMVAQAGQTRFTFDRDKANAYFRELGRSDRLPDRLHGTTLVVSTPAMALLQYAAPDGKPAVMVGQAGEVQVGTEGAASLDEVRDYLLNLPGGLPPGVADQLRSIQDWRTTLPIPVRVDKVAWRETKIQGGDGLVLTDNTGLGSAAIWRHPDGRIYGVAGPLKGDELQRVVDRLR